MRSTQDIQTLGRYKIVSKLGEGGMGVVYKAVDSFLERTVALKIAKISAVGFSEQDKKKLEQCLKEARHAAQFIHPNIVIIYDAGIEKDLFYIALEYIDGKGLHEYGRKSGLLPQNRVLEVVYNTCYALDYIHRKGYLHLDIKPSNIMLNKMGEVKLMDFGISRFLREEKKNNDRTKTIGIHGTPYYMSPEQANSNTLLDHQTDIFALGVVLYELLAGRRPFEGENAYQILYRVVHDDPVDINEYASNISPDLGNIIKKALSKKKKNRFKTAKEFADSLLPIIKGKDSRALDKQDKKKIAYLKRLLFFKHFQYAELMEVIKISSWNVHKGKTWIIKENERDNNVYFIVHGKALLNLKGEVKVLRKGECFGETAVLYNMQRQAAVMADTDCVVLAINANLLKQSKDSIQVKFLKEFYNKKILQLVDANLKLIRTGEIKLTD